MGHSVWYRRLSAVLVGAFAVACSSLQDIPRDTCGNHVLEKGEDCDTPAGTTGAGGTMCIAPGQTGACRFGCGPDNGNAACPSGWACGTDGICREASGQFQPLSGQITTDAVSLGFGDYDGDGLQDVRGSSDTATEIHYGSTTGDFSASFRVPSTGRFPATGDLSDDAIDDLAFPLNGDVAVWRGTHDRTLQPTQYPSFPVPGNDLYFLTAKVLVMRPGVELVLFIPNAVAVRDVTQTAASDDKQGSFIIAAMPGKNPSDLAGRPVAARVDESPDFPCDEVLFAYSGESAIHVVPTCFRERINHGDAHPLPDLALPKGATIGPSGILVSDLNGDGHLDVLIDVLFAPERGVYAAYGHGDGTFDAPVDANAYFTQFPLAVGQLTRGDSLPDYVLPNALILNTDVPYVAPGSDAGSGGSDAGDGGDAASAPDGAPPAAAPVKIPAPSTVTWTDAVIADVNGNGIPDVICGGNKEVDFFNGTGTVLQDHVGYPIDGAASKFAIGDFDGDMALDIAYAEHPTTGAVDAGAAPADTLKVLWGNTLSLPSAPESLGAPGPIKIVIGGVLSETALGLGTRISALADLGLLLASSEASSAQSVAVLLGSTDRQLESPFGLSRPRPGAPPNSTDAFINGQALALAIGNFGPDVKHPDLGAVGYDRNANDPGDPTGALDIRLWMVPASGAAQLDGAHTTASDPKLDAFVTTGTPSALAWNAAQCAATALSGSAGALDTLVTLVPPASESRAKGALFFAPIANGTFTPPAGGGRVDVGIDTGSSQIAWRLMVRDINADGAPDVLVFANTTDGPRALVFWNEKNGALSAAPIVVPAPKNALPFAAAALNADGDPQLEIAILTEKGVFLANLDDAGDAFTVGATALPGIASKGGPLTSAIAAGDANGDGIDDLALVGGGVLQIFQGTEVAR